MGSAGRAGGLCLIWLCTICACQSAASPTLAERCEQAADARQPDTADLCLPVYELTGDPAAGARAARALQSRDGALPIIEWIANAIGDRAGGADAWLALGVSRSANGDSPGALAAYERAAAVRSASDTLGQLHDAVGLLYYHLNRDDYRAAVGQAAIAYNLVHLVDRQAERVSAYINIASLLVNIGGNPCTTADILDEARRIVPVTDRYYAHIRQLDAMVEQGRDHPALQRLALLEAHALAIRDGNRSLESDTRFNLIDAAIHDGDLDEAALWLRWPFPPDEAETDVYARSLLAVARGDPRTAIRLVEQTLPFAAGDWVHSLEDVRGRALAQLGDPLRAEQSLRRAVEAVERARDTLQADTFKSWLLAAQRAPFEDLFLLYVSAGRLVDALEVVQRATARSTLDGLLESQPVEISPARGITAAGAWSEGMHKLARSLRASHAMATPPIDAVLARLRGNHVITYFRARSELWAIAIAADGALRSRKIGSASEIAARVAAWRHHPEDTGVADQLGGALLPDELMPPPGVPLFVVEEDPIAEVSFAALRRRGQLVLDQHAVAYAPSAAVLSATRRSQSGVRALVLGDPTGDLPQAREEAKEVADRLKVKPRLGADAATAAVLGADNTTVIHIAAHTVATETGAALQLSDGLLDAGTVLDRGVAAGAIVLLTCSSAPITSRDELAPLASAFIAAGAHTVVASRWAVPDSIARSFAGMFYEANGVADPVAAVAMAQRELVRRHVPVEQWATFALIGGLP
jgi:tetratricopeptide (TPR) repeat protein